MKVLVLQHAIAMEWCVHMLQCLISLEGRSSSLDCQVFAGDAYPINMVDDKGKGSVALHVEDSILRDLSSGSSELDFSIQYADAHGAAFNFRSSSSDVHRICRSYHQWIESLDELGPSSRHQYSPDA